MTGGAQGTATSGEQARGYPPELVSADGELVFDGCGVRELAATYGTPLWIVSRHRIEHNYTTFREAFASRWDDVEVNYSMKANNWHAVIRLLARAGAGLDCTGENELRIAIACGADPSRIIVNGNGKSEATLRAAAELGVRQINIDSLPEVDRLEAVAAALGITVDCVVRLQLGYEELLREDPSFETTIRVWEGKFGSTTQDGAARRVVERVLESEHLGFAGLSHHVGFSGVAGDFRADREVHHHRLCTREVCEFAASLPVACERLDLGGGFRAGEDIYLASPGGGEDGAWHRLPGIDDYATAIVEELEAAYPAGSRRPVLQFETGGYQVADAAVLATRVIEVKDAHGVPPRRYASVDSAMTMFTSKGATRLAFPMLVPGREHEPAHPTDVVGQSCNYDALAEAVDLPELEPGELIVALWHGAYSDTTGTHMNALSQPAVVLADAGRASLVKRRDTLEDIASRNEIPAYLWTEVRP